MAFGGIRSCLSILALCVVCDCFRMRSRSNGAAFGEREWEILPVSEQSNQELHAKIREQQEFLQAFQQLPEDQQRSRRREYSEAVRELHRAILRAAVRDNVEPREFMKIARTAEAKRVPPDFIDEQTKKWQRRKARIAAIEELERVVEVPRPPAEFTPQDVAALKKAIARAKKHEITSEENSAMSIAENALQDAPVCLRRQMKKGLSRLMGIAPKVRPQQIPKGLGCADEWEEVIPTEPEVWKLWTLGPRDGMCITPRSDRTVLFFEDCDPKAEHMWFGLGSIPSTGEDIIIHFDTNKCVVPRHTKSGIDTMELQICKDPQAKFTKVPVDETGKYMLMHKSSGKCILKMTLLVLGDCDSGNPNTHVKEIDVAGYRHDLHLMGATISPPRGFPVAIGERIVQRLGDAFTNGDEEEIWYLDSVFNEDEQLRKDLGITISQSWGKTMAEYQASGSQGIPIPALADMHLYGYTETLAYIKEKQEDPITRQQLTEADFLQLTAA